MLAHQVGLPMRLWKPQQPLDVEELRACFFCCHSPFYREDKWFIIFPIIFSDAWLPPIEMLGLNHGKSLP